MRLLLALLVLAGLLVVGDRVAAGYAERQVAEQLQRSQGLAQPPEVGVRGFPFLTQAVAGEYREVTVVAEGVDLGQGLRAQRLDAVLSGVRVPLSSLLGGGPAQVPADRLEARVGLAFDDLEQRAAPDAAESLQLTAGEADDEVRVSAVVRVLGRDITLVSDSRVSVDGSRLRVTTDDIRVEGDETGATGRVLDALTGGDLDFAVDTSGLPFGLQLRDVQVTESGLVAVAGAEGVVLEPGP